jgi:hypothetical protein
MKRALLLLCCIAAVSFAAGCVSLTSWNHNKRHLKQLWNELQGLHEDMDRIIFGLERNPAE